MDDRIRQAIEFLRTVSDDCLLAAVEDLRTRDPRAFARLRDHFSAFVPASGSSAPVAIEDEDDVLNAGDDWDEEAEIEERFTLQRCGCAYCPCVIKTENGETCSDCLNGVHQG